MTNSTPRLRTFLVAVLLVTSSVLAACTSPSADGVVGSPPTTTAPPAPASAGPAPSVDRSPTRAPGLSATATASTLFDTQRTFRLELSQVGPDVQVTSLQLSSPWYEPLAPVARDLRLGDGARRLVPLPYGAADCRPATSPADDGPLAGVVGEVVVETTDGIQRVPLVDHPVGLVAGRHARECAVAAAGQAVHLAFGRTWDAADPRAVTGTIHVAPLHGEEVEVRRVEGNIIFTTEPLNGADDVSVTAGGTAIDLPVRVAAARCDTHALIEAKRKFHHVVEVSIDGADPVVLELEATGDTRRLFQSLLEACLADPEQ